MVMRNAATESSKTDFPALYDELETKIRALESLGGHRTSYVLTGKQGAFDKCNVECDTLLNVISLLIKQLSVNELWNLENIGIFDPIQKLNEKNIWNACVKCRRFKSKSPMADPVSLPSDRVKDAAVFEVVGVDLSDPLYVARGDKVWIVLYTCAIYRALHLE
ncbi:integrase catalytic domain-containing protein [Trichonephila inaurata madagascariensis]|uniref:Integrase catalytic domain-containing protein n=1 Tax=Trichonephila inaurata madagascariensis TaxID=2747483 RepID=A0A8X7BQ38_9ARAC|nr:integrase catalytic domain-containing protein [Trichonephila inaurata madagascariensis]